MSEARDSGIKLFGRTIAPPESQATGQFADGSDPTTKGKAGEETKEVSKETSNAKGEISTSDRSQEPVQTEQDASASMNGSDEGGCQVLKKDGEAGGPKSEKEPNEVDGSTQQKVLKKPDKILPCPRCKSLDTKFCYYNNYNVNQPRHFCKNCQRYWTAGGTMRNVPVGAGRRKNKHSASHYRHMLAASDAIPSPHLQVDQSNPVRDQVVTCALSSSSTGPLKSNCTVLKLSDEAYHCDPLNSVLNLGEKRKNAERGAALFVENGEEPSCASPLTSVNGVENKLPGSANCMEQRGMQSSNGPPSMHHLHCYAPPWTYPWLSGWKNVSSLASVQCSSDLIFGQDEANAKAVTWNPPLMMAAPPFCAPALAFPLIPASVPASFWGCMSGWPNGMWNGPWIGSANGVSPSSSASNGGCSGNSSAVLGKHSRDTSEPVEEKTGKSLWVPKTLRIDDPDDAAKSSIWATLGIIPDPNEPVKKARIFSGFQPINEVADHHPEGAQVLHVNPAALSRSQTFQESK